MLAWSRLAHYVFGWLQFMSKHDPQDQSLSPTGSIYAFVSARSSTSYLLDLAEAWWWTLYAVQTHKDRCSWSDSLYSYWKMIQLSCISLSRISFSFHGLGKHQRFSIYDLTFLLHADVPPAHCSRLICLISICNSQMLPCRTSIWQHARNLTISVDPFTKRKHDVTTRRYCLIWSFSITKRTIHELAVKDHLRSISCI